jgi:hypothetical protein
MLEQNKIYCIYLNNNEYTYSGATLYQDDAFKMAKEFFKNPTNLKKVFNYDKNGYKFSLKNRSYAYEMIKEYSNMNQYNQYLAKGEENRDIILSEIEHPPKKHKSETPKYPCPICSSETMFSQRYPLAVCHKCSNKTATINGDSMSYYNTSPFGGFEGINEKTKIKTTDSLCYIDGHKCYAQEARFGGIVVQLIKNK